MKRSTLWFMGAIVAAASIVMVLLPLWGWFVGQRIAYPFPIDYGEGPLLRQLTYLQQGGNLAGLYGDPGQPPYLVVNYPPVYLVVSQILGIGMPALMAGRLVSALAGLAVATGLWLLMQPGATTPARLVATLVAASWLTLPIVREWSAVMRVDMLGVALGIIGLVLAVRGRPLWGTALIALSLLTKPSLVAAPLALLVFLIGQPWRIRWQAVALGAGIIVAVGGGISTAGGNIWLHVVQANVNVWDDALARGFWREAWQIHAPLMLASIGVVGWHLWHHGRRPLTGSALVTSMAIAYTLGGIIIGLGIGKVGAYANYFLEWYAGMIWLVGCAAQHFSAQRTRAQWVTVVCVACTSLAVARYIPLWSETYPKPYGMIEQQRPARLSIGSYGVWQDLQRERAILNANAVTATALNQLIASQGTMIFTDVPGIAAQAGVSAPMQVFEHRQLADIGLWDQRPMLRMLANGTIPLVVLDYLGNWMTPESIALIETRYAQSGSRGSFDVYQPIAVGAPQPLQFQWDGLRVNEIALPPPLLQAAYEPGTPLPVLLTFTSTNADPRPRSVHLQLVDGNERVVARSQQELFAGALTGADAQAGPLQHLQALSIPYRSPDGTYRITARLDDGDTTDVARIVVQRRGGRMSGENGYLVPAAVVQHVMSNGGEEAWGSALMPAMPFNDTTLQCFEKRCVWLQNGQLATAPIGTWLSGALAVWPHADRMDTYDFTRQSAQQGEFEGEAFVSVDQPRAAEGRLVWLRRDVELWYADDTVVVGNGGTRLLRLPGIPYRWPPQRP